MVAVLGTSIATYFDIFNNRNIPDLMLYSFFLVSVVIAIIDFNLILICYSFGVAAVIGLFGYFLYKAGQLGAADVFVLCSLVLLLPIQPVLFAEKPSVSLPFIFSIIIVSGLTFILYILIKFTPIILKQKKKLEIPKIRYLYIIMLGVLLIIFLIIASTIPILSIHYLILLGFLIFSAIYFMLFKERLIESLIENIPLRKIEPEDIIALEYINKNTIKKYKIPRVVSKKDLQYLKKAKIKKYPVFTKMPMFMPFILIGLLVSIIFGDVIYLLTASAAPFVY